MNLLRRKSVTDLQTEALTDHSLKRALGALNLTMLGIGAIIGTGIFVLTGTVAAQNAGPAVVLSFVLAGVASVFAALCYSEFASLVPMAGSAYTYGYATLGEIFAWIIGWDLILEYALGAVTVAIGWSGYVVSFLKDDLHLAAYSGLTVILFVLWPEQQGLRYLFPILPFLVYFCYRGMRVSAFGLTERYRRAGDWLTLGVWTGVLVSFLLASIRLALHPTPLAGPFQPATTAMFEAVRQQAAPGDVVIFDKPRLMRLMTDRDAILIDRCDELAKGRFVVVRKAGGATAQIAPGEIATCDPALELTRVFDNRLYAVYRIARRPGPA